RDYSARAEDSDEDLLDDVAGQRARRVVVEEGERHAVQRREQGEQERDGAEPGAELLRDVLAESLLDAPALANGLPRDVLADDLLYEHDDHREERQEQGEVADEVGRVVLGPELL